MAQEAEITAWLETERGDKIALFGGLCSIGRAESNTIILNKQAVSRHHAIVHERDKEYWLVDLGSVNGVLLNGDRVAQSARLSSGDRIQIPSALFIFQRGVLVIPAPAESKKEPEPESIPKPEPIISKPLEDKSSSQVTVPLPLPTAARQDMQSELALVTTSKLEFASALLEKSNEPPAAPIPTAVPVPAPAPVEKEKDSPPAATLKEASTPSSPEKPKEPVAAAKADVAPAVVLLLEDKKNPAPVVATEKTPAPVQPEKPKELPAAPKPEAAPATLLLLEDKKNPEPVITLKETPVAAPPEKSKELPETTASSPAQPEEKKKSPPATKTRRARVYVIPDPSDELPLTPVPYTPLAPAPSEEKKEVQPISTPEPAPVLSLPEQRLELPIAPAPDPAPAIIPLEETKDSPPVVSLLEEPPTVPVLETAPAEEKKVPPQKPEFKSKGPIKRKPPTSSPMTGEAASSGPRKVCRMAQQSMYLGLASIFLPFIGLVTAVIAIAMGHGALKTIRRSNGALTGLDSAKMGLYFGYATVTLILTYSTLIFIFFPSLSSPVMALNPRPSLSPLVAPIDRNGSISLSPVPSAKSMYIPGSAASQVTPTNLHASPNSPDALSANNPTPPSSSSTEIAPVTPAPTSIPAASPQETSSVPSPGNTAPTPDLGNVTPPQNIPPVSIPPSPAPDNTPPPLATTESAPADYSPEWQSRLKDRMLSLPMPTGSTDSPGYMDAEAFNDAARILARKPETKYAESVQEFLEGVKARNPDQARFAILSAMYENYLAGLPRQ